MSRARPLGLAARRLLGAALGRTVIVESKPGAGATLGADRVAKAKPDGYTLLVGAVHHTIASSVYQKLPSDSQKDFAPITQIALVPNVLVVNAATPAHNVADLAKLAKSGAGKPNHGSNGNATAQHPIGTQFQNSTGTEIAHIPYKGSGPLATPRDVVARLNTEMVKVIQSADFRKRMAEIGAEPIGNGSEQMAQVIKEETEKFARLVKEAKVSID